MSKWTVIVPTYAAREKVFEKFMESWRQLFEEHDVQLVVMFDGDEIPDWVSLASVQLPFNYTVLSWKDMDKAGIKFIPKQTDMCRSFAFYWAYKVFSTPYMLTLDDDVRPVKLLDGSELDIFKQYEIGFKGDHLSEFFSVGSLTTTPMEIEMRGYPYKDRIVREVAVQYGGWHGVLDYDAATQLSNPKGHEQFLSVRIPVPKGAACTCCIMNCAWQRQYTPIMWQLPMLEGRYNRVGDIWSGLLIKKTLDAIGAVMLINGCASILHDRASNPYESLKKEAPSVWLNDNLWERLTSPKDNIPTLSGYTGMKRAYDQVIFDAISFFATKDAEFAEHFARAYGEWKELLF